MKRKKISRRKYSRILKKNTKFHKRNLPGFHVRAGRRYPL